MTSKTEPQQSEVDLDKFFSDLEAQLDESEVARLAQAVMEIHAND